MVKRTSKRRLMLLVSVALFTTPHLFAQYNYEYFGNPFTTNFTNGGAPTFGLPAGTPILTPGDLISGTISLSSPLPADTIASEGCSLCNISDVTSFNFNVGPYDINNTTAVMGLQFGTSGGQISAWELTVTPLDFADMPNLGVFTVWNDTPGVGEDIGTILYEGAERQAPENDNDPGIWSGATASPSPEPSTLFYSSFVLFFLAVPIIRYRRGIRNQTARNTV
jgi:hypothetical protein